MFEIAENKLQYLIMASDGLWDVCDDQASVFLNKTIALFFFLIIPNSTITY